MWLTFINLFALNSCKPLRNRGWPYSIDRVCTTAFSVRGGGKYSSTHQHGYVGHNDHVILVTHRLVGVEPEELLLLERHCIVVVVEVQVHLLPRLPATSVQKPSARPSQTQQDNKISQQDKISQTQQDKTSRQHYMFSSVNKS